MKNPKLQNYIVFEIIAAIMHCIIYYEFKDYKSFMITISIMLTTTLNLLTYFVKKYIYWKYNPIFKNLKDEIKALKNDLESTADIANEYLIHLNMYDDAFNTIIGSLHTAVSNNNNKLVKQQILTDIILVKSNWGNVLSKTNRKKVNINESKNSSNS